MQIQLPENSPRQRLGLGLVDVGVFILGEFGKVRHGDKQVDSRGVMQLCCVLVYMRFV